MKKIMLIALSIIFFSSQVVFATEQIVSNDQAYATFNIQKQPETNGQKQKIDNHFTFFTINIQINGKIKDIDTATK